MPQPPQRPADAELVHRLRTRRDELLPEMSFKAVADKIAQAAGYNFYPNKVRRIESGESKSSDLDYAWLAWGVGASVKQVEEVGRPEAARLLREIIDKHSPRQEMALSAMLAPGLTAEDVQKHLQERLAEIRAEKTFTPEERASMEEFLIAQIELLLQSVGRQIVMHRSR